MNKTADVLEFKKAVEMATRLEKDGRLRDAALIAVTSGMGLRISDALNLRWQDVEDDGELKATVRVREGKTGKTRAIRMLPFVARFLKKWSVEADHAQPLFPGRGGPLTRMQAYRIISQTAKEMGLKGRITPHSLRKAFCSHAYNQTKDPVLTARVTGHSNPSQLMHYIGVMPDAEAAVFDGMARGL